MLHKDTQLTFYFIRHAECVKNTYPDIIGGRSSESPLTDKGKFQAKNLGFHLCDVRFDHVFSSPFMRAVDTAKLVFLNEEIVWVDALMELDQGQWQGQKRSDVYSDEQLVYMNSKGYLFTPPGGESQRDVEKRVIDWLEGFIKEHVGQKLNIGVVFHGIALKCLLHYLLNFDEKMIYKTQIDNCSVTIFKFDKQGWWPIKINQTYEKI